MPKLYTRNQGGNLRYYADLRDIGGGQAALKAPGSSRATTDEIDQAVIYGPGLRWASMGTCLTFHLAGGQDGMAHMLRQY